MKFNRCFIVIIAFLSISMLFVTSVKAQTEESPKEYPLSGKTIILDPGHGGRDHGFCMKNSVCERDIVREISKETAALLKKKGANVILTRDDSDPRWFNWSGAGSEQDLDSRILLAGQKKADIFVSIHCNASQKPHRAGSVVFYQENFPASRALGDSIQKELIKIPENSKRTDRPGSYYLLNKLSIPAVVIETCYLTHRVDKENITHSNFQKKIAQAISSGVNVYFSADYNRQTALEKCIEALSNLKTTGTLLRNVEIGNAEVRANQAFVDIKPASSEVQLGGEEEYNAVYAIVNNTLSIPGIRSVQLTLNGKTEKTLAGHIDISSPFTAESPICMKEPLRPKEGKKVQVAIVIDDFGQYNTAGVKEILSLDVPITCAVMPNLENTVNHAEEASKLGQEVIIHLPLEPVKGKKSWLGPGAITMKMSEEEIKSMVGRDFDAVPHAVGFNNHMGSAATANERIMRAILQVAREREFFVLDSKTTDKTCIPALSDELGISCVERNVFLDEVKNSEHVKAQLSKLRTEALKKGKAIGIGHVGQGGKATARALKEMIPAMEKMGIEFVYLSEIAY